MSDDEIDEAHRAELRHMVKYWRDRAIRAEEYIQILSEVPEASVHLQERIKCKSDMKEVKCSQCTCWKSKDTGEVNEP